MKQQNLEAAHAYMKQQIELWLNGLIKDNELAFELANMYASYEVHKSAMADLHDPNTGLRH
jgi:hypothetical protein